ncbi:MAG: undecaprenyldiphospho-muramoylpentapeptide beta-N-acetylglucosaminyltransferase [Bacteroidetes bacterium]|nr:MAG: undecaprenyldiphospho-muramoylpentapeptide beta-N-acetylglucosaminyltransferase [Bacteroidota bacterium]
MTINRVIISGGGTGGHVFPAIAIANEIRRRNPSANILFIGAKGKMEMEKVPEAGYNINGLPIAGFQRKISLSNFTLPFKIIKSIMMARNIIKTFKPELVIGVGGYASGPTLRAAAGLKIPTLIQEQNSFPGKTNKILSKRAHTICTAYEGLEKFFPKEKIVLTGNPVRAEVVNIDGKREKAYEHYQLDSSKKTILIIGGSLGARTLNESVQEHLDLFEKDDNIQLLWQCGRHHYGQLRGSTKIKKYPNVKLKQFIHSMDLAYAAADVIISRAGAISVSELCLIQKPAILVPSPNVAEDHQTKNAQSLLTQGAVIMIKDNEAVQQLIPRAFQLLHNPEECKKLQTAIAPLGIPDAAHRIVDEAEKIALN